MQDAVPASGIKENSTVNTMESYQQEVRALHHRRVNYIVLGGGLLMLLFAFLDYLIVPELFSEFFIYRLGAALFGIALYAANYHDIKSNYSFVIGFCGYLVVMVVIMVMIFRMGGTSSPYYVGLIISVTLYVTLAPLTMIQTLVCGLILIVCYFSTIRLGLPSSPLYSVELFSNLFFIICFVLIIATQSWADTAARRSEYRLREEERSEADELSQRVKGLELEVEKRSMEQEIMEERYRLLFDQIADGVVVVNPGGLIVQSNIAFNEQFCAGRNLAGASFFDISPEEEHKGLKEIFLAISSRGIPVSAGRFSLYNKSGTLLDVEINGSLLERRDEVVGILLIIRDLTIRKEMEEKLKESLEIKKKTEVSAILVLAKLSEFKDLTPANHLERIREYCKLLAMELSGYEELGEVMTSNYIEDIYHASILHDIGKVAIPDEYMAGDAPLEEYEKDYIRRHTLIGGDVIKEMAAEGGGGGFLPMAKHIAYFHHERWDSKGYPYGLAGREIPLAARIMALADYYEERTVGSGQEPGRDVHRRAVDYIISCSGTMLDPMLVDGFVNVQESFYQVLTSFPAGTSDAVEMMAMRSRAQSASVKGEKEFHQHT
ncbi:HD-GYP domain-containing protein [Desulfopila sp. IMCC35008]|uniref:HD-GYP domain-containing protein n=1 Tax=Desulfopila sp. IMCC35008 TaxID=2653858 RepID=UPI0013D80111|nr:HD domain-containing phosphohydrolase [Desulfopila sp. IMCC35008]